MTINLNITERHLWILFGALIFALAIHLGSQMLDSYLRARRHSSTLDRQRTLDHRDVERAEKREHARLLDNPLPGPALVAEAIRRHSYALACDATGRTEQADRQRSIADQFAGLTQIALAAQGQPDVRDWRRNFDAAKNLIGAPLHPLPGWDDPHVPDLTDDTDKNRPAPVAEGSAAWGHAVRALRDAIIVNAADDDFGPGQTGLGALTSAGAYGYAAAPDLPRETVVAFMQDWMRKLHGERLDHAWPADIIWPSPRRPWMQHGILRDDPEWEEAVNALARSVTDVVTTWDFRGLYGAGKTDIIGRVINKHGRHHLPYDTVSAYVTAYGLAITGQADQIAGAWPDGVLPAADPSRILPLDPDLQPDEVRQHG